MKKGKLRNRLFSALMAFILTFCCAVQIVPPMDVVVKHFCNKYA